MTINTEIPGRVAAIVKDLLTERFRDEFVFDPIVVRPEIDHDGGRIPGDLRRIRRRPEKPGSRLDSWTLPSHQAGVGSYGGYLASPGISYVEKSEWEELFAGKLS